MSGFVSLVGAGPGDPGLLTVKAARRIAEAEVLVYDALASEPIIALAPESCERLYVGKRARLHTMPQAEISALLIERALQGRRVVRLKGGDPFVFGRGAEEAQELHAAGVPFEIVPGISSALAAPAYAGIPVTHRSYNTNFSVATGHEDPLKGASTLDWSRLADGHGTSIFLMGMGNLAGIVDQLQLNGRPASTPVAIISDGTTPRQRTVVGTLKTIVAEVERTGIAAPAVIVVGEAIAVREQVRWFDRHPLFGQRVLLTRPQPEAGELGAILWELGAEPLYAATIARTAPHDPQALSQMLQRLLTEGAAAFDWLVFTSRYGVQRFFLELQALGKDARVLGGISVAAIGPGTADALARAGVLADLIPLEHHSEGLAELLLAVLDPNVAHSLLLWTAEGGRAYLRDTLLAAGHEVHVALAYGSSAVCPEHLAEAADEASIWTFASGSAVRGFLAAVPDWELRFSETPIVCIGPSTAQVAQAHGLQVTTIAQSATLDGILTALIHAVVPGDARKFLP